MSSCALRGAEMRRTGDTPETHGGNNHMRLSKGVRNSPLTHTHIHTHTSHKSRLSPVLMTEQLFSTRGSHNPSWGLINLLEWPTEHKEKFYSLDHWFVITGCNSGTPRRKRCTRQVWGEGLEFPWSLDTLLSPMHLCSPAQTLSNPFLLGFNEGFIT